MRHEAGAEHDAPEGGAMLEVVALQFHCAERCPPQAVQLERLEIALCIQHLPVSTGQASAICELFVALCLAPQQSLASGRV